MPVAVPNSFNGENYQDNTLYNNRNDINYPSDNDNNLMDENQIQSYYFNMNRLEEKIRRLENINDIFLNIIREKTKVNKENSYKNYSFNDLSTGPYPYLSFDKNKNKTLLYLNRESINNNKIEDRKYKENYLLPILPKYNSIQENNRISYLLNEEKLKYLRKDSEPFFYYDFKRYNNTNIPQKINSVQYFNKKVDYEKLYSSKDINIQVNPEKKSEGKKSEKNIEKKTNKSNNKLIKNEDIKDEINKLNDILNKRLLAIEDLQKNQKKDIDFLMGRSKENNKSEKGSKKETNKKEEEKKNDDKIDNDNKDDKESNDDDNEDEEDDEEEKELGNKKY